MGKIYKLNGENVYGKQFTTYDGTTAYKGCDIGYVVYNSTSPYASTISCSLASLYGWQSIFIK